MGGLFGVVSKEDCVADVFYGNGRRGRTPFTAPVLGSDLHF